MTETAANTWIDVTPREASVELPDPVPFGAPVLIGDCASPLAGETVLSLLWKRLDRQP